MEVSAAARLEYILEMKIAFVINPIAGMGGKVGLKGTDGSEILARAMELNAVPEAGGKATKAIESFLGVSGGVEFYTASGPMGSKALKSAGIIPQVVHRSGSFTTDADTKSFLTKVKEIDDIDLVIFVGGDGTARDVCDIVGEDIPVIGIPAGVKIHSSCFAINPERGGDLAASFIQGKVKNYSLAEVMDLDEELYRKEEIQPKLFGYLKVPNDQRLQNRKSGSGKSEVAQQGQIAFQLIDEMKDNLLYLVGPGTTTRALCNALEMEGSLLGVDAIRNKKLLGTDLSEQKILDLIQGRQVGLIITPTGGQGFLLGRGNHQISPQVLQNIDKENIIIASTMDKIVQLHGRSLLVDTGDDKINIGLSGFYKVVTGFRQAMMYKVES